MVLLNNTTVEELYRNKLQQEIFLAVANFFTSSCFYIGYQFETYFDFGVIENLSFFVFS